MQNTSSVCPRCQSAIPADAPGGICPVCALRGVVEGTEPGPGPAASVPTSEEIAAAFPEYEVLGITGRGGMGVLFKVRQPRLDRLAALKILSPPLAAQPGFAERFTREARALARLAHPHIVAVYDFGERAGFYYLVMEFVDGVNLRQALRAGITPEQALQLVPRICEALQFAHDRGVLHRDIKPENILLDRAGVPKLADFGIAKLAGEQGAGTGLTATGAALGTAVYMAPEQIEKPSTVDHRADIYSLGVVLYEMLTGELPLGRFAAPSEKSDVGRGIDEVVLRALEKERERRQQSATEMKTQVEGARDRTHPLPPLAKVPEKRLPAELWARIACGLAVLSAVGIPISAMLGWSTPSPVHMVALVFFFGALTWIAKSFVPRTGPAPVREKDLGIAYVLWFLFGVLGGHRFYLGQIGWGLLYFFTGGLFFVGWVIDLFTLPSQVRMANDTLRRQRQSSGTPPPVPVAASNSSSQTSGGALVALAIVAGLMIVGTVAIPWKNGKWHYTSQDGNWSFTMDSGGGSWSSSGHFSSDDNRPAVTPAPSTPAPAKFGGNEAPPKPDSPATEGKSKTDSQASPPPAASPAPKSE